MNLLERNKGGKTISKEETRKLKDKSMTKIKFGAKTGTFLQDAAGRARSDIKNDTSFDKSGKREHRASDSQRPNHETCRALTFRVLANVLRAIHARYIKNRASNIRRKQY
jgi:hypothetical protein